MKGSADRLGPLGQETLKKATDYTENRRGPLFEEMMDVGCGMWD